MWAPQQGLQRGEGRKFPFSSEEKSSSEQGRAGQVETEVRQTEILGVS